MNDENCRAGHCWSDVHCGGCHDLNVGPDRCQGEPISPAQYGQVKARIASERSGCLLALLVAMLLTLGACEIPNAPTPTTVGNGEPPVTKTTKPRVPRPVLRPNPRFTPGEVMPNAKTAGDVCGVGSPGRDPQRQVNSSEWQVIATEYRVAVGAHVVEKDHLIAYWAGGASSVKNVWPMFSEIDKDRKDRFETYLYHQVCKYHAMDLQTARYRMVHFWLYWSGP